METLDPYAPPQVRTAEGPPDYGEIKIFSAKGRIGRVRYIAYLTGFAVILIVLMVVAGLQVGGILGSETNTDTSVISAATSPRSLVYPIGVAAFIVFIALLTIQRAHDFNVDGWLALLIVVPLLNLIFLAIPGTQGENRFGKQTPPNGSGAIIPALIPIAILGLIWSVIDGLNVHGIRMKMSRVNFAVLGSQTGVTETVRSGAKLPEGGR